MARPTKFQNAARLNRCLMYIAAAEGLICFVVDKLNLPVSHQTQVEMYYFFQRMRKEVRKEQDRLGIQRRK